MGNIITPTPGDLTDRQTILEVKLEHLGVEGDTGYALKSQRITSWDVEKKEGVLQKSTSRTVLLDKTEINIQPFLLEHESIQEHLERDWFTKITPEQGIVYDTLHKKIHAVNLALWTLEDQARVLRIAPEKMSETVLCRKAETLDAITQNNDLRADLVKQINSLWDINVQEKVY
jgi:hypothetical protein